MHMRGLLKRHGYMANNGGEDVRENKSNCFMKNLTFEAKWFIWSCNY